MTHYYIRTTCDQPHPFEETIMTTKGELLDMAFYEDFSETIIEGTVLRAARHVTDDFEMAEAALEDLTEEGWSCEIVECSLKMEVET